MTSRWRPPPGPAFARAALGTSGPALPCAIPCATSTSDNVIAIIPGSQRPDETIIYTAHWDHLGTNPQVAGDNIYNGAQDNASGTVGCSLARLFSELPEPPERTVVFLAVTAEEAGLLGPVVHRQPALPAGDDRGQPEHGRTGSLRSHARHGDRGIRQQRTRGLPRRGGGQAKGRYVAAEPHPERGYYYRSDHFNFARHGMPALYAKSGEDSLDHGAEWGQANRRSTPTSATILCTTTTRPGTSVARRWISCSISISACGEYGVDVSGLVSGS